MNQSHPDHAKQTQTSIKGDWWASEGGFFGDLYMEADNSFEGHLNSVKDLQARTAEEVAGVIRLCGLAPDDKILDCPCGYGRHSLGLARARMNVTGADINQRFLTLDQQALAVSGMSNCQFIEQDMRTISFQNKFDTVINMFYSFGFFDTDEENAVVIRNFYNALKPGGRFLMHTHVTIPRLVSGRLKNHQVRTLESGRKLELLRTFNAQTRREDGEWYLLDDSGNREKALTPYSCRLYSSAEWIELCKSAGFSEVKIYGDWSGGEYSDASPQLIAVATK